MHQTWESSGPLFRHPPSQTASTHPPPTHPRNRPVLQGRPPLDWFLTGRAGRRTAAFYVVFPPFAAHDVVERPRSTRVRASSRIPQVRRGVERARSTRYPAARAVLQVVRPVERAHSARVPTSSTVPKVVRGVRRARFTGYPAALAVLTGAFYRRARCSRTPWGRAPRKNERVLYGFHLLHPPGPWLGTPRQGLDHVGPF